MKLTFKAASLIFISLTISLTGCASLAEQNIQSSDASAINHKVIHNINVDNYFVKGENTQMFEQVPQRVVVVGENETETLLEIGAAEKIIMAVAQNQRAYAMKPANKAKFTNVPKCSGPYLNMEYMTKLQPDLIIAQQCIFVRNRLKNTDYWNNRGTKTLVPTNTNSPGKHFYQETVAKEMDFLADLGTVFGVEATTNRLIAETYQTIANINQATAADHKPKVMIVEFLSSLISYDRTKLVGDMVTQIGGQVAETEPVIGLENIIEQDPDVLFVVCSHADYGACRSKIVDNPALSKLQCVKNSRVYSIPLRFTYGAAVRTIDGIKFLAARMYPELSLWDQG